jgi:hypothetical protein
MRQSALKSHHVAVLTLPNNIRTPRYNPTFVFDHKLLITDIRLPTMATTELPVISKAPSSTDPAVYQEYESKWSTYPTDSEGWLQRARDVAAVLVVDAAAREKANKSPRAEVALLKHSGLLKLLGPKKYGGGEQPWSVGYKAIREVAKGDGYVLRPLHP